MKKLRWNTALKFGFWAGIGWWFALAITTLLDYGIQMLVYTIIGTAAGQAV